MLQAYLHQDHRDDCKFLLYDLYAAWEDKVLLEFMREFAGNPTFILDDRQQCLAPFDSLQKHAVTTFLVSNENLETWHEELSALAESSTQPRQTSVLVVAHARVANANCPQCGCLGVNDMAFREKMNLVAGILAKSGVELVVAAFDTEDEAMCPVIMGNIASAIAA